jgi:carotenoid cleavage dioxygenase-like enzyme
VSTTLRHNNAFVHEQAFSARWHVQVELPLALRPFAVLAGRRPVLDCFAREDGPCVLHLVPRDPDGGEPLAIPCPDGARAVFHVANAWDEGDVVIVDAAVEDAVPDLCVAAPDDLRARQKTADAPVPPGRLMRFLVDTRARTMTATVLASIDCEQPTVSRARYGQRHRYVYCATPGGSAAANFLHHHAVARIDTEAGTHAMWDFGPRSFVGQPAFVARGSDEDDGWLLAWVLDAARGRTDVAIFDARAIERGPVAVLDTGTLLPGYNHARFYADRAVVG